MATPDAWDDDWETAADKPTATTPKPPSSKITKAQRRAQQAEFNRQLWEEAEGPREPNYFLETRGVVPKADFKPPPRLLSRKAPRVAPSEVNGGDASSDEAEDKKPTVEEQRALAAKEREEKQRKYEERRLELFGSASTVKAGSGTSSPGETPPGSRSATPNRSRGRGGGGGRKADSSRPLSSTSSLSLKPSSIAPAPSPVKRELYDPNFVPKPETNYKKSEVREIVVEPIRSPRGPDGSGRGGFGFAPRGGKNGPPGGLDT